MAWVKVPTAATAAACAACVAAAMALPAADTAADRLVKAVSPGVHLSAINFDALDWLSALPLYQALLDGNTDALRGLDSLNGIPGIMALLSGDPTQLASTNGIKAYVDYLQTGNLEAFRSIDLANPGLAALNALPVYAAIAGGDLSELDNLDSTSAIQSYAAIAGGDRSALGKLDSTSAIPVYEAIAGGDLSALGKLDSTSAVPLYSTVLDPTASVAKRADAVRGLDAFSAIPEYLGLPSVSVPAAAIAPQSIVQSSGPATIEEKQAAPEAASIPSNSGDSPPAVTPSGPVTKVIERVREDVGNLGKFTPKTNGTVLFPTGGGGAATDTNDTWHKVLHSVGLGGAGASEGDNAGTG